MRQYECLPQILGNFSTPDAVSKVLAVSKPWQADLLNSLLHSVAKAYLF